jgi:hypothetical protein
MTRALVASTVKEAISEFTNRKEQNAEIISLKKRLNELSTASNSSSMNFLAHVSDENPPSSSNSNPLTPLPPPHDFLEDYMNIDYSEVDDDEVAMVAMTLQASWSK